MRIERFEDIEAWQFARELTRKVYGLDAAALPFEVSSRHTSGGLAYEQGQRKKGNPER